LSFRAKSFRVTKNPRLTGNRGFQKASFRLKQTSRNARASAAALPEAHENNHAMALGPLGFNCRKRFHSVRAD
jgi:hypothetical protein